jgi:hypothetical protein
MKTNLAIFRGTVAAPALQVSRANKLKQNRSLQALRDAEPPRVRPGPALVMLWRINATSGQLECRWSLERSAQSDEGVSYVHYFLRRAA